MSQPLWRPSPERIADAVLSRFCRETGQADMAALYRWSIAEPEAFWREALGLRRHRSARGPARLARRPGQDAGREDSSPRPAQLRREPAAPARRQRRPGVLGRGQGRAGASPSPSSTHSCRASPQAHAGGGRRAPATASPATCPTCRRRSSPCWRRRAWARSGRPARPISACRACSTASARSSPRCCSPPTATSTPARPIDMPREAAPNRRSSCRASSAWSCVPYVAARPLRSAGLPRGRAARAISSRHPRARRRASSACRSTIRSTSCTRRAPPGVPEVHRARRRRHAAAAPQGASAAQRHPRRRPAVLLHHLRLDDVELARLGPRLRRDAAALRRLAVRTPTADACGTMPRRERMHHLRHLGQVHRRLRQGGLEPRETHDLSSMLRIVLSTGSPLAPGRLRLRLSPASSTTCCLASISGGTDIISCFVLG